MQFEQSRSASRALLRLPKVLRIDAPQRRQREEDEEEPQGRELFLYPDKQGVESEEEEDLAWTLEPSAKEPEEAKARAEETERQIEWLKDQLKVLREPARNTLEDLSLIHI